MSLGLKSSALRTIDVQVVKQGGQIVIDRLSFIATKTRERFTFRRIANKTTDNLSGTALDGVKETTQNIPKWIYNISAPNNRHSFNKINQKTVKKELNTVIDSSVDIVGDMTAIKKGQASIKGNQITVNNRIYERKPNGTLYPISGNGFTTLNRTEFSVLAVYIKFGNTKHAEKILNNMKNMTSDARMNALDVWKRNKK